MFKENGRSMIKKAWNVIEKIMYVMVVKVLRITILEKNWESFLQFVKFGIIGVSNTVISYVIYIVSLLVLQKNSLFETTDYLLAQILGFLLKEKSTQGISKVIAPIFNIVINVPINFLMNKFWAFKKK